MKRLLSSLPVVLILLFLVSGVVYAIGNPDSITVESCAVYEGVLEEGDQLYFVSYNVGYSSTPSEDPEDTWQLALYESGTETLIKVSRLHYYGRNVDSVYLGSEYALTSEGEHFLRVMGMPSVFGVLTEDVNMDTYQLSPSDWYPGDELGADMLEQAGILGDALGQDLITDGGKLNNLGTTYFLAAIPRLDEMDPSIFGYITAPVNIPGLTYWDTNYTDSSTNKTGSRLRNAINGTASIFGISDEGWGGVWLFSMLGVMLAAPVFAATRNPYWALVVMFPFLLGGAWIGIGSAELLRGLFILVLVLAVIVALVFWLRHLG